MKKIYWIWIGIVLIVSGIAAPLLLSNADFVVIDSKDTMPVFTERTITFLADGRQEECIVLVYPPE